VRNIYTAYQLSKVLFGVSLELGETEIVALLGRNGVGKTTTLRSIMGLTPPNSGSIIWKGKDIVGKAAYEVANMGVGYVPDDRRIFSNLTVWENLDVAVKSKRKKTRWTMERVYEIFPALDRYRNRKGGYLSGGEQQMLAIGRTLMGNPDLLLLDEPSEGLAPIIVSHLTHQISELRGEKMTILLSEQNLKFCLDLSDRLYILEKGKVRFKTTTSDFDQNIDSYKKYLAF
jgi:branched-chain amino acid transport system ATP-binding protein